MYKLVNNRETNKLASITKNDGSGVILSIPVNPQNSDYIAYLKWIEEGNVPTSAEE